MRWALLCVIALGCNSSSGGGGEGAKALAPEAAALVRDVKAKLTAASAADAAEPTTLPRCPKSDDALLIDRRKAAAIAGDRGSVPAKVAVDETMQTQLGCGASWEERFRSWIPKGGDLPPAVMTELQRAQSLTVAFCYWREDVPGVFRDCGVPDPTTHVARCSTVTPGRSAIDVVRHPANGAPCANRVVVEHPPYEDAAPQRARRMATFLERYFSARGRNETDPCTIDGTRLPYRITVDGAVACAN